MTWLVSEVKILPGLGVVVGSCEVALISLLGVRADTWEDLPEVMLPREVLMLVAWLTEPLLSVLPDEISRAFEVGVPLVSSPLTDPTVIIGLVEDRKVF